MTGRKKREGKRKERTRGKLIHDKKRGVAMALPEDSFAELA